jgi:hypothetical protein
MDRDGFRHSICRIEGDHAAAPEDDVRDLNWLGRNSRARNG